MGGEEIFCRFSPYNNREAWLEDLEGVRVRMHQTDFSTGSVQRNIMEVAVPMIAAQLLNLTYNIVDRIYIGRIPGYGTLALTGVGLCFPLITLITAFSLLFGNGGAPLCSIERGKGDEEEAQMLMGNTFAMLMVASVVLTVLGLFFYRPILYAFGASDVTFPYAQEYIRVYLLGTIFVMTVLGMNNFYQRPGIWEHEYVDGSHRSSSKYCVGSAVYLCPGHGRERGGRCHHSLPGFAPQSGC